jgi:hypothetical protein
MDGVMDDPIPNDESFPGEHVLSIGNKEPLYADFANFLVSQFYL